MIVGIHNLPAGQKTNTGPGRGRYRRRPGARTDAFSQPLDIYINIYIQRDTIEKRQEHKETKDEFINA